MTYNILKEIEDRLSYNKITGEIFWKKNNKVAGSLNQYGYRQISIDGKLYVASRVAFVLVTGNWPINEVDHINRNNDDNRWDNLRDVTSSENKLNRKPYLAKTKSKFGVKGVRQLPSGRYQVRGYKQKYLGNFESLCEAKFVAALHWDYIEQQFKKGLIR